MSGASLSRADWFERIVAAAERRLPAERLAGLPGFPPDEVQIRTTGQAGRATLEEGFRFYVDCCEGFQRLTGRPLGAADDQVLDFGTGWGRILRFFAREVGLANCHGTDVNADLIEQTRARFGGGHFAVNAPFPPTAYADGQFALIVGYSVFSHLSEAACRAWIKEFYRIVRPDGVIALTTRGRWFFDYCEALGQHRDGSPYQAGLGRLFADFGAARAAYDGGHLVHATSELVAGDASLGAHFYGETFIPEGYARTAYLPLVALRDWLFEPGRQTHPVLFFAPAGPHRSLADPEPEPWPAPVLDRCRAAAARHDVAPHVHPADFIFRFLHENPAFDSTDSAIDYYFQDGRHSALKVQALLERHLAPGNRRLRLLEFAAGYGAVTRHASRLLAHELHGCDIHPEANAFLAEQFGVRAIQSTNRPEDLALPVAYDLIFVLSFFSHMPRSTWSRWLARLHAGLCDGGVLLFTTHGQVSRKFFPHAAIDASGFWFEAASEQKDLDTATYGQTIVTRDFVMARIAELPGAELLEYTEAGWWRHQDLYLVRRAPTATPTDSA